MILIDWRYTMRGAIGSLLFPVRGRQRPAIDGGGEIEARLRRQARLGPEWSFGLEDVPHFLHCNGRHWLIPMQNGHWEIWIGHRLARRVANPRNALRIIRLGQLLELLLP